MKQTEKRSSIDTQAYKITFEKGKTKRKIFKLIRTESERERERETSGVDSIPFLQSVVHESKIYETPNQRNSILSEKIRGKILGKRKRPEIASRGGFWFSKRQKTK
jgi:hypothetical protein